MAQKVDEKFKKATFHNSTQVGNGYSGADIFAVFRLPDTLNFNEEKERIKPKVFAELSTISYSTFRDKFPVRAVGHVKAKGYTTGSRTVAGTLIFKVFDKYMINKMVKNIQNVNSKKVNILPDELPPFDIDITLSNELGYSTRLSIIGVDITEGNQVMSVSQMGTSEKYSFVAQDIVMLDYEKDAYQVVQDRRQEQKEQEDEEDNKPKITDGTKPKSNPETLNNQGEDGVQKSQEENDTVEFYRMSSAAKELIKLESEIARIKFKIDKGIDVNKHEEELAKLKQNYKNLANSRIDNIDSKIQEALRNDNKDKLDKLKKEQAIIHDKLNKLGL